MPVFFVSYDLSKGNEDECPDLWDKLKELGAIRVQKSLWALKSDKTAEQLRENLKAYFPDKEDRLMVIKEEDWAGRHSMNDVNKL